MQRPMQRPALAAGSSIDDAARSARETAIATRETAFAIREPALAMRSGPFVAPARGAVVPSRTASRRDEVAILAAWRRFGPLVQRTLERLLGSDEEVRDLSQEAFLQLYRSVSALRSPKAIRPFVDGIAVRLALHELRRRRVRGRQVLVPGQGLLPPRSTSADPEAREAMAHLMSMVGRLRAADQEIYVLSQIQGLEQTEISAATRLSISTVRRRLRRIRGRIDALVNADPALASYVQRGVRAGAGTKAAIRRRWGSGAGGSAAAFSHAMTRWGLPAVLALAVLACSGSDGPAGRAPPVAAEVRAATARWTRARKRRR